MRTPSPGRLETKNSTSPWLSVDGSILVGLEIAKQILLFGAAAAKARQSLAVTISIGPAAAAAGEAAGLAGAAAAGAGLPAAGAGLVSAKAAVAPSERVAARQRAPQAVFISSHSLVSHDDAGPR